MSKLNVSRQGHPTIGMPYNDSAVLSDYMIFFMVFLELKDYSSVYLQYFH